MRAVNDGVYAVCVWVWRLAWLNMLWLLFTLMGLVLLGFFPATVAGYQVARDWIQTPASRGAPLFRRFAGLVRRNAVSANAGGAVLLAIGALLAVGLQLAWNAAGEPWQFPILAITVIAAVVYLGGLVHLPFLIAHVSAPAGSLAKAAWLYGLAHPAGTVMICAAAGALSFLLGTFPAAALFFCFSPIALLTALLDVRGYRLLEHRRALAASR